MATQQIPRSPFIAQLLAPLPADQAAKMADEVRKEQAEHWHERWILAHAAIHRKEVDHWERLHNAFYGGHSRNASADLSFAAFEAVENLVLTPALSRENLQTKRVIARKVANDANWPSEWVDAIASDEGYLASRKKKLCA